MNQKESKNKWSICEDEVFDFTTNEYNVKRGRKHT